MAAKSGHEAVVEQLLADGFGYIFGNSGTSEEGLLDTHHHGQCGHSQPRPRRPQRRRD